MIRYNSCNKKDRLWRTNKKWCGTIVVMEDKRKVVRFNSSNKDRRKVVRYNSSNKDRLWNGQTKSGTVQ